MTMKVRAVYPYHGDPGAKQLSFNAGAILDVKDLTASATNGGWAYGCLLLDGRRSDRGWFPANYVQPLSSNSNSNSDVHRQPQLAPPTAARSHQMSVTPSFPTSTNTIPAATNNSNYTSNPFASNGGFTQHQTVISPVSAYSPTIDDDNGFSPSHGPMGGEWNGSNAMTGKYDFAGNDTYSSHPTSSTHTTSNQRQEVTPQWATGSTKDPPHSPSGGKQRWNNMRGNLSKAATKTGSAFSNAATKTGTAISNAASRTAGVARQTTNETGQRFRDMNNQHQNHLNQNEVKQVDTQSSSSQHQPQHPQKNAGRHERSFASGGGLLPGRKTDTYTTTERTKFGGTKTTVTTTQRASGGFIPYIPGKSTTTTTTTRDAFGNTRSVQTNTQSGGGFGIIPLGPVGLAAVGAIAAKNALDSHKDRRNQPSQQQQQQPHYQK